MNDTENNKTQVQTNPAPAAPQGEALPKKVVGQYRVVCVACSGIAFYLVDGDEFVNKQATCKNCGKELKPFAKENMIPLNADEQASSTSLGPITDMNVKYVGPARDYSGYGEAVRHDIAALLAAGVEVRSLIPSYVMEFSDFGTLGPARP
jgi:hypothetical protein